MILYRDFLDLSSKKISDIGTTNINVISLSNVIKRSLKYPLNHDIIKEKIKLDAVKEEDIEKRKETIRDKERKRNDLRFKFDFDISREEWKKASELLKERKRENDIEIIKKWSEEVDKKKKLSRFEKIRMPGYEIIVWENFRGYPVLNLRIIGQLFHGLTIFHSFAKQGCEKYQRNNDAFCRQVIDFVRGEKIQITFTESDIPDDILDLFGVADLTDDTHKIYLVYSHFLFLYFDKKKSWRDSITVLLNRDNKSNFISGLEDFSIQLTEKTFDYDFSTIIIHVEVLNIIRDIYRQAMSHYFWKIFNFFSNEKIITFPTNIKNYIKSFDINAFDQLNLMMRRFPLIDSITDEVFKDMISENIEINEGPVKVGGYFTNAYYPILYLHFYLKVFLSLTKSKLKEGRRRIKELRDNLKKTEDIVKRLAGDENNFVTGAIHKKIRDNYVQNAEWVMRPENSGIVKISEVVSTAIADAYFKVQQYVNTLKGLPLIEIQKSINTGLAVDFATFVAVLISDTQSLYPNRYIKDIEYKIIIKKKTDAMKALKNYSFSKMPSGRYRIKRIDRRKHHHPYDYYYGDELKIVDVLPVLTKEGTLGTERVIML
jgi:hypothetical protein